MSLWVNVQQLGQKVLKQVNEFYGIFREIRVQFADWFEKNL
jgi:hypothetical protein